MRFKASAYSRSAARISRSMARVPPLKPRKADHALPSIDFGPVDFSLGFQRRSGSHCPSAHVLQQSAMSGPWRLHLNFSRQVESNGWFSAIKLIARISGPGQEQSVVDFR